MRKAAIALLAAASLAAAPAAFACEYDPPPQACTLRVVGGASSGDAVAVAGFNDAPTTPAVVSVSYQRRGISSQPRVLAGRQIAPNSSEVVGGTVPTFRRGSPNVVLWGTIWSRNGCDGLRVVIVAP